MEAGPRMPSSSRTRHLPGQLIGRKPHPLDPCGEQPGVLASRSSASLAPRLHIDTLRSPYRRPQHLADHPLTLDEPDPPDRSGDHQLPPARNVLKIRDMGRAPGARSGGRHFPSAVENAPRSPVREIFRAKSSTSPAALDDRGDRSADKIEAFERMSARLAWWKCPGTGEISIAW